MNIHDDAYDVSGRIVAPCWLIHDEQAQAEHSFAGVERRAALAVEPFSVTAGPSYYPRANRTAQWFGNTYPGTDMGGVDKVLLHTTETGGWPGYAGGASAPTLTYDPRKHEWRQHFLLHRSARALRDPDYTLVRENRDKVIQVEIVACSDHTFADRYGYLDIKDLDDRAVADLGAFIRFCHDEFGVPLVAAPVWVDYPASYGDSPARMTGSEYDAFRGVLGHEHASGNDHGDPNGINVSPIMAAARGEQEEDDMPTPAELWAHKIPDALSGTARPAQNLLENARRSSANAFTAVTALTKLVIEDAGNDITQEKFDAAHAEVLAAIEAEQP